MNAARRKKYSPQRRRGAEKQIKVKTGERGAGGEGLRGVLTLRDGNAFCCLGFPKTPHSIVKSPAELRIELPRIVIMEPSKCQAVVE
jgi:hypothetical protein